MFSLDDLAKLFELTVREDTLAGGLTVSTRGQTIVLTAGQGLASVGGRLISLPAPPVRDGRTWFVPVDFVPRALAPAVGTRLELRKPSRLVLSGDVRAPRVAGNVEPLGALARVTLDVAPSTPHTVAQDSLVGANSLATTASSVSTASSEVAFTPLAFPGRACIRGSPGSP